MLSFHIPINNQQQKAHSLVFVYDGVEELAVPPAGGEVITADALVAVGHPLGPDQQLLLGCHVF